MVETERVDTPWDPFSLVNSRDYVTKTVKSYVVLVGPKNDFVLHTPR